MSLETKPTEVDICFGFWSTTTPPNTSTRPSPAALPRSGPTCAHAEENAEKAVGAARVYSLAFERLGCSKPTFSPFGCPVLVHFFVKVPKRETPFLAMPFGQMRHTGTYETQPSSKGVCVFPTEHRYVLKLGPLLDAVQRESRTTQSVFGPRFWKHPYLLTKP